MKTEKEIKERIERLKLTIADFYLVKRKANDYYDPSIIKLARIEFELLTWILDKGDYVGVFEMIEDREKEIEKGENKK